MQNKLETELFKAAVLTFEDLCLALPTEKLDDCQRSAVPAAAVRIGYQGSSCGKLIVMVSADLLSLLPANMLALAGPVERQHQEDALLEVANVICGNMLPGLTGSDEAFRITPPEIISVADVTGPNGGKPSAEVHIGIHQGRADLLLFIEKTRP